MTLDSNRPMFYSVTIDGSSFTDPSPANGFIDNTIVEKYMDIHKYTGDSVLAGMTDGDTIHINEIAITFTTAGGLDIAGVVSTINAFTEMHHAVASDNGGGKLVLTNEDGFEGNTITVDASAAILAEMGYSAPVLSTLPGTLPSDLAHSEAKVRGNIRWRLVIEQLERDVTPMSISSIVKTGANVNTQPSAIAFTVGFATSDTVYTYDESNSNAIIEGIPAIKRMIARAITEDKVQLFSVFDPTTYHSGAIIKGARIESIHVGALAADLATAEAAITVAPIASIR